LQIMRDCEVTQKTAWFMLHKVRGLYGITDEVALDGEVEMDEMYLGGRELDTKTRRLRALRDVPPRLRNPSSV